MSIYRQIKDRLLSGWYVQEVKYKNCLQYEIVKKTSDSTRDIFCVIGKSTVNILAKDIKFVLVNAVRETMPLNFSPQAISRGHCIVFKGA